jgi:acyl-CoA thioester hydrolase
MATPNDSGPGAVLLYDGLPADRTDAVPARERANPLRRKRIQIAYADTDAAGIIYFAAWFPWMERIHTEWLAEQDVRFPELMERCGASVVTRATACEYLAVVRPYDEVDIAMSAGRLGPRSYRMDYVMTRVGDRAEVARASMTLVGVDAAGLAAPLPALIRALLVPAAADDGLLEDPA